MTDQPTEPVCHCGHRRSVHYHGRGVCDGWAGDRGMCDCRRYEKPRPHVQKRVLQEVWIDPKTDEPVFGPWMGGTVPDQPAEESQVNVECVECGSNLGRPHFESCSQFIRKSMMGNKPEQNEPTADDYIHATGWPTELLPCPVCGGKDTEIQDQYGPHGLRFGWCHTCDYNTPELYWNALSRMRQERDELLIEQSELQDALLDQGKCYDEEHAECNELKGLLVTWGEIDLEHANNPMHITLDTIMPTNMQPWHAEYSKALQTILAKARQLAEEQDDE